MRQSGNAYMQKVDDPKKRKDRNSNKSNIVLKHNCEVCGVKKIMLPVTAMIQVNIQPAGKMWVDCRQVG